MKGIQSILLALAAASTALASPAKINRVRDAASGSATAVTASTPTATPVVYDWTAGGVQAIPIHASCNATERRLLSKGFDDALALASHARDHILRFGNSSEFYTKYFGQASTGEPLGWFEKVVHGDRSGVWFRCDDIDGNCHQDGWAGHWRGENATSETVICPLSYEIRKPLEGLCGYGYTVAGSKLATFFGADLVHRFFHMPQFGEGVVEHYADTYSECLELAKTKPQDAVRNTHSLQYFALDVYAYDISLPGEGCTGKEVTTKSAAAGGAVTTTAAATPAKSTEATKTTTGGTECHTHSNGDVHCS